MDWTHGAAAGGYPMTTTSYADVKEIRADLERWRDEDADPREARAALFARYHRATDKAQDALGNLDSEMFSVVEADTGADDVAWREATR
jgi:hypothetical protein